ncbi:MAG: PKD-like domain-containing protein, partial [Bacteroidota bacterium]
ISGDPFGVFGGAASPIYVALADFNFSQLLTNMSATTQNLTFSVTPYFETTPGMGATQDMDECEGGTINFTVRIRPEPQAEFANMDTMRVCSGEMVNIMFTGSVGVVVDFADDDSNPYTATVGGAPVVYNATTTTTPDTVRFGITQLTQTYPFVTCTAMPTDSFVLIINPLPAPSISTNATGNAICNGDMIDIIFTDAVGEGPWNVTLNGTPYNVANSGDVIGTFGPLTADSAFVLTSVTDANGCSAPLAAMQTFVDSLSVLVDDIPDLTSVVTINDLIGGMVTNTDLNSGLLDTTVCALSDISIAGSTTTPMSNNGDPLYVQLTFMDDQPGGVWPSYDSMTELFVPVADLETALDALPTNTGSTAFTGSVIMTPYFETNTSVPSLDMGECVGLADTFRVTVSPRPNANPTSFAETICSGDEFTFDLAGVITNFVAGTTFTYTTSSTSANTTADPRTMGSADGIADTLINLATVANGNSSQTVTYVVTPMAPGGCVGGTFTIDVEVLPAPVLDTNDGDQICSGDDLGIQMTFVQNIPGTNQFELISVTNDAMGTGFMADAGNRMVGDTFNLNIIRDDSYENRTDDTVTVAYTFVPMSSNGCNGDTATYEVRIIPEPRVEDITISVCSGTRLDIDIFQDLVANMVGDTAIFFRSSAFAEPINVFNEDGDQVCNATFGCEPQMGPPGLIVGRRGSFIRDSVINTGTATSQIIYDVYVNDSDNYCANDVAIPGPPRFIENGPNGLGTAFTMANRFTLTVNILREASVTLSASATEFCSGDPITLTPNFTNGNGSPSFTYSVLSMDAGVDTITFDTSGTGNSVIVDGAGAGVATILVEASDEFGCFATNTIDITVGDTPEDRVIEGFEEPCAGSILSPYRLEPGADPGNFYEWSLSDPTAGAFFGISSGFGLSSVVISWNSAGGPFTLTCVETSPSGCTNNHSLDINVVQNSAADFSFTVNPNNTLEVLFFEAAQGDVVEYNWDFGDGMGTSTDEDPVYTYAMAGTYNVTLTTRSLCGGQTFDMVTKPVTVGGAVACQTISLQPGLNFVSLNVIPADSSITALFGATPEVVQINGWQSGAPNLWERSAGGFNSLNEFNRGFGYLVSATAAVDVIICGTPETGTYRRPLDQGVNYIGTTLTADVAADTYFATLNTNMDLALAYIIENGAVRLYDPGAGGFNDLTTLEAGKAYIIVMNSAVAGGSYRASTSEEHEFIYGIVSGNGLVNGEPVEVVNANGEVVASFMPDATGLYKATPIFGALSRQDGSFADGLNYGEAYYFRHNGITVDAGMSYNGSYRATRLDFNFETSVEADAVDAITVSPNPIAAMTKVDLAFSVADRYEVKVLDVTGRTVSTLTNAYQEVGNMSFNWNTSQLSAGVYTIVVLRDGALLPSLTTRVIK